MVAAKALTNPTKKKKPRQHRSTAVEYFNGDISSFAFSFSFAIVVYRSGLEKTVNFQFFDGWMFFGDLDIQFDSYLFCHGEIKWLFGR